VDGAAQREGRPPRSSGFTAIAAMAANEQRGLEMSRWVLRAMPRMPAIVRDTDAAAAMILAAIGYRSDGGARGLETRPLPPICLDVAALRAGSSNGARLRRARQRRDLRAPIVDESEPIIEVPRPPDCSRIAVDGPRRLRTVCGR
jgi:hypothetical protein